MKTVKALMRRMPTSTYCSGRITKKASSRARWSARRVWVSVTNSRSAKNETKPNSSVEPSGPEAQAIQNSERAEPERAQLAREALARRRLLGVSVAQRAAEGDQRDQGEQAEQDDEQQPDLLADAERSAAIRPISAHASRSAITAARARSRKARRSSPGASAIGAPKTTVHRIGTGTTSPLGMTRWTLSIQAGISCTSGNACASANRPDLNGAGSAAWPRVPSGKMTSESPWRSASISGSSGSSSSPLPSLARWRLT